MANKQGGRRRHGSSRRNRRSSKCHHQKPPRRGQGPANPWRPWQLDGLPDDPVWAARRAVQLSDLLTQRFLSKGDQ